MNNLYCRLVHFIIKIKQIMNDKKSNPNQERLFFLMNQSTKGSSYVFLNIVPACRKDTKEAGHHLLHKVVKKYTFDTTSHLRFLNELLHEKRFKEAQEHISALFRRVWWFRTQNRVSESMLVLGAGYSVDGFMHALGLAYLMFVRDSFHKSIELNIDKLGECTAFSEYETEIAILFA